MGRPEYTPPEILELLTQDCRQLGCAGERPHRTGHACVQRTRQHDAFALAALTFRILMAGEDPFGQHPDMAGRPGHLTREAQQRRRQTHQVRTIPVWDQAPPLLRTP